MPPSLSAPRGRGLATKMRDPEDVHGGSCQGRQALKEWPQRRRRLHVGIVTEARQGHGIRHEHAQLISGAHGIPLTGDKQHGRARRGEETHHVRCAHGKHGGIESHRPAAVAMLECGISYGVGRQQAG